MTQTAYEQNIIRKANARSQGTYDVYIEIDCDCEELLDACGIEYNIAEEDTTQNEVALYLTEEEFCDIFETCQLTKANEVEFGSRILNPELGEYCTKVTVYKPNGDKIIFQ